MLSTEELIFWKKLSDNAEIAAVSAHPFRATYVRSVDLEQMDIKRMMLASRSKRSSPPLRHPTIDANRSLDVLAISNNTVLSIKMGRRFFSSKERVDDTLSGT